MEMFVTGAVRSCQADAARRAVFAVMVGALLAAPNFAQQAPQVVKPERFEIDVRFEPERGFLHAKATVTMQVVSGQVRDIEFELNPHLKLLEVKDAQGRSLEFTRSGRLGSPKLSVRLAEPVGQAQGPAPTANMLALAFVYQGVLPRLPLDYITKDGILLRDESRWYPATDLAAFAEHSIRITVPPNWMALAGAELAERNDSTERTRAPQIFRWNSKQVSSRAVFAAPGHFHNRAGTFLDSRPRIRGNVFAVADRAFPILQYYSNLLENQELARGSMNFRVVEGFPGARGIIGYSAPGFLIVSADVLNSQSDSLEAERKWDLAPEFLPHEIAHQWFPIEVTLKSEEDGWLAESLAEYLAWRYLQERDPEQARLMVSRAMRDSLEPEPLRPLSLGLKLFSYESQDITHKTLYQRGMLVFRTLETVIGRSRVDRTLREYYTRFAGRSASVADFRKVCEDISQRDLGWFFKYFINGTEIPEIALRRLPSSAPNEYLGEVFVKNAPPDFQVRVEMKFFTSAGVVDNSVALRGDRTPVSMSLLGPAERVVLDPDSRILRWTEAARRNREQKKLLAQLGELEDSRDFAEAVKVCEEALAIDSNDLAANAQKIRFQLARLRYRMKQYASAFDEFGRMLTANSIEPMNAEFYRVWARVYRARILRAQGKAGAAQSEIKAGLALAAPVLDSPIAWPELAGKETTARKELLRLRQPTTKR
jgi:tetratricopeptide (TPR) repeat protein